MGYVRVLKMIVVGLDVSSDRVDAVFLDADNFPKVALRDFYLSPSFGEVHAVYKSNEIGAFLSRISSNKAIAILESTGVYSYFWRDQLQKIGITVLVADQGMVRSVRRALGGTDNKDDKFDALIMCELYRRHYLETYDRRFWVRELDPQIKKIRRSLLEIKSITRKQTACINTLKSRLSSEYPARAKVKSQRHNGFLEIGCPPAFWGWLANRCDFLNRQVLSRLDNHFKRAAELGANITDLTRQLAASVCDLHDMEASLEHQLIDLLGDSQFAQYHQVFDRFGMGYRERGWILCRTYPFQDFLCLPKKRALRRFRQACGMGKVERSSGKVKAGGGGGSWTGCANTRSSLWTYVHSRIEPQKLKGQNYTSVQLELREYFVGRAFEANGTKKRGGQLADARNATSRKLADLMFRELYKTIK
ncbi:MAG: IS110 family transposase [Oscillatoriales cyanobacterium]|nr:MAG: IS110 family transposase [Oscillatoriales cyanobacterium]